jgi:hypothetical protein
MVSNQRSIIIVFAIKRLILKQKVVIVYFIAISTDYKPKI